MADLIRYGHKDGVVTATLDSRIITIMYHNTRFGRTSLVACLDPIKHSGHIIYLITTLSYDPL